MTKIKYDFEIVIGEIDVHIIDGAADRSEMLCFVIDLPNAPEWQFGEPSNGVRQNFCKSFDALIDEASYRMRYVNTISAIKKKFPAMDRSTLETVTAQVHRELSKLHQNRASSTQSSQPSIVTIYRWMKRASKRVDSELKCEGQVG